MTAPSLDETTSPDTCLEETYRQIAHPQHSELRELLALWEERPSDGLEIGRDIPSRRFAPLLSHILFWEPIDGGADYKLHLSGAALRLRFGDGAVGKHFSDLVAPSVRPSFLELGRKMQTEDRCVCFDMYLQRSVPVEGRSNLHFEMVIFPVWSHGRKERWILNGTYYFL